MKRLIVLVAVAALVVGVYTVTAGAGQKTVTITPAKIEKQVKKLQKQVKQLRRAVIALAGPVSCLQVYPEKIRTNYVLYSSTSGTTYLGTGLDTSRTGETPNLYAVVVPASCVSGGSSPLHLRPKGRP